MTTGAMVMVNCETDFAAKNEQFVKLAEDLVTHVLGEGPDEVTEGGELNDMIITTGGDRTVKTVIDEVIGVIGENMGLSQAVRFTAEQPGVVHSYIHPPGKLGVLVDLGFDNEADKEKASEVAHELALQIAFADPSYISPEDIPENVLAKEREIAESKAREQGKPDHIVPKIAEGMLRKYYSEECLLEQPFAKDTKISVKDFVKSAGVAGAKVRRFARFALK
jgi:elongation factor Ts